MDTNSDTKDDIIDLTEIVEEGFPPHNESVGKAAADPQRSAESLDQELDDLLEEPLGLTDEQPQELLDPSPHEKIVPAAEHIVDLTDVVPQAEAPTASAPTVSAPTASTPAPEVDYLGDVLISEPDSAPAGDTSLDLLLEEDIVPALSDDPLTAAPVAPEPKKESESLSFDPETMLEPKTRVAPPQTEPASEPVPEKESFDTHVETSMPVDLTDDLLPEAQSMAAEQASDLCSADAKKDTPVQEAITHDPATIVARLDALEDRAAGFERATLDQARVLAALPDNPEDLPFAAALRANILEEVGRMTEEKLEAASAAPQLESLRKDVTDLSSRLTVVEDRSAEPARVETDQILAALPDNPEDLPFAAALRANILEEAGRMTEEKLEVASAAPQLESLRKDVADLSSRLTVVEDRSAEPVRLETNQVLAALPDNPEDLPFAAALRANILEEAGRMTEEKLEAASAALQLESLRKDMADLSSRLTVVEDRSAEPARIETNQVLAALPDNPEDVPYAATLRTNILEEVNERMAGSLADVDELHQTIDALQDRVGTLSDSLDRPASTQDTASVQELETELHALREIVLRQENDLLDLQKRLTARELEIAFLRESKDTLSDRILEAERAREEAGDSLRTDLRKFIEDQVPGAAAKIIREEIQKLLQSMDS